MIKQKKLWGLSYAMFQHKQRNEKKKSAIELNYETNLELDFG